MTTEQTHGLRLRRNYISKDILSRASQRRPAMDATVRDYRATWGWLVIAGLLAVGILALFLIP